MDRTLIIARAIERQIYCLYAFASADHFRHAPNSVRHIRATANATFADSKKKLLMEELNPVEQRIFDKLDELRSAFTLNTVGAVVGGSILNDLQLVVGDDPMIGILLSFLCEDVNFTSSNCVIPYIYMLDTEFIRGHRSSIEASFDSSKSSSTSIFNFLIEATTPHFNTSPWNNVVAICVNLRLPLLPDAKTGLGTLFVSDIHVIEDIQSINMMPIRRSLNVRPETYPSNNIEPASAVEAIDADYENIETDDTSESSVDSTSVNSDGEGEDEASTPKENNTRPKSKLTLATNDETLDDILTKLSISRAIASMENDQSYPTHIRTLLKKWQTMFLFLVELKYSVELMEAIKKTRS